MRKNVFRWLIALAILLPCLVISASAETEGYYTYSVSGGKATITDVDIINISGAVTIPSTLGGYPVTGIGDRAFYSCDGLTSVTIPDSVTSIGDEAFCGCSGLTSVTIGNSVTSIGEGAFYYCTSLTQIEVAAGNTAYCDVDGVLFSKDKTQLVQCPGGRSGSYTIPDSVTSIGYSAFYCCYSLTSVTIPDGVTSIGDYAFYNCDSLTSVTIPDSVTSIGYRAFYSCDGLTQIEVAEGNAAYCDVDGVLFSKDKTQLVQCPGGRSGSYTIPDSVTSIGEDAFYGCSGLTSVTIGNGVTSIGSSAFYYCTGLTSVTIPDGVTSIGDSAFYYCDGLTSVTIGNSVTSIGYRAFYSCDGLTQIEVAEGNAAYCDVNGVLFSGDKTLLVQYPVGKRGSYTIPDSVTSIGEGAFRDCDSLTSVTIPDSVTSIGEGAFRDCTGLTSVTIPDGVTNIGDSAFYYCDGLTSVTIGNSVTSIGDSAFYYCDGLTSVTIGNSVTSIGDSAFYYCDGLTSVTIGNSVTSIGYRAFYSCDSLTRVDFLCDKPTLVGTDVFASCDKVTLYYHAGTSGWPTDGTWQGRPLEMQPHTEAVLSAVSPTCGATGLTEGSYCDVCGEVLLAQTEIPALGHDYIDHAAKAPTTESVGWEAYQTCSRCDYSTYKELPKLEEDKPVVSAAKFKFSLEVVGTVKQNGQTVEICRWVWTPVEE